MGQKTKYCIICGAPAQIWTGHVLKNKEMITAGYCDRYHMGKNEGKANQGEFKIEFGLMDFEDFNMKQEKIKP